MGIVEEFLEEFEIGDIGAPGPRVATTTWQGLPGLFGPGVYALTVSGDIVYVGKARVLVQRLYAHWNSMCRLRSGKPAFNRGPKGFVFAGVKILPCPIIDLDRIERQMIARHKPKHNKKLVPEGKMTLEQIGFDLTRLGFQVSETPIYRRRLG
mgnify:CR=1 FL=1